MAWFLGSLFSSAVLSCAVGGALALLICLLYLGTMCGCDTGEYVVCMFVLYIIYGTMLSGLCWWVCVNYGNFQPSLNMIVIVSALVRACCTRHEERGLRSLSEHVRLLTVKIKVIIVRMAHNTYIRRS